MMQTNNNLNKPGNMERSSQNGAATHHFDAVQKNRIRICEKNALSPCIMTAHHRHNAASSRYAAPHVALETAFFRPLP